MIEKDVPRTQLDAGFFDDALQAFGPRVSEIELTIEDDGRRITKTVRLSPTKLGGIPND